MSASPFVRSCPKVELHAHLNGSLDHNIMHELNRRRVDRGRDPVTLPDWAKNTRDKSEAELAKYRQECDLAVVFGLFPVVQALTDDEESLSDATAMVLEAFAADNIKYVELRTSPKTTAAGLDERRYAETVIRAMRRVNADKDLDLTAGLLLSLDRSKGVALAEKTVDLAKELLDEGHGDILVGIDLSGNPSIGDARDYIPALRRASSYGPKLAVHLAEVPGMEEETVAVLSQVAVGRVGHGTCIHPDDGGSEAMWKALKDTMAPVEVCLSSNVMAKNVKGYDSHHVRRLHADSHPYCACTDDLGIFLTDLSTELAHLQEVLGLSDEELYKHNVGALEMSFASEETKSRLRILLSEWYSSYKSMFE